MARRAIEAELAIARVIRASNRRVDISSGKLNHLAYNNAELLKEVENALKRGVRFRVLVGPEIDPETKRLPSLLQGCIYRTPAGPRAHFTVGDGRHVRFETRGMDARGHFENEVRMNTPVVGSYLLEKFEEAWRHPKLQLLSNEPGIFPASE